MMAEANDKEAILKENLMDAGCSDERMYSCIRAINSNEYDQAIYLLREHRKEMVMTIDECYQYIDCLDYLVYKLSKEKDGK